ncbi:hypothetical protein [Psychroserpens sp. SPM9]|uniref:hypothetical protein n=1 Tax=Psychroserpens sp. SPM9 TaxID=2975598 RepID=UPI0021A5EA4A|nr:hypothetical protein [Psychroserpens sp. SPM9]MDG5490625.1 hypothetical protein [Psychroserpens sp. SPM9]
MTKKIKRQANLEKACDHALWLNFKHRVDGKTFGVIQSIEGDYLVSEINHPSLKGEDFEVLPRDYSNMTYNHIRHIGMDENPLAHFEEIKGMFSTIHGEILRFILSHKIPLEKFIRYELASRGHDENHRGVGFEKSQEIWLT